METQLLKKASYVPRRVSMAPSKSAPLLSKHFRNKAKKKKKMSKVKRRLVQKIERQVKQLTTATPTPFGKRKGYVKVLKHGSGSNVLYNQRQPSLQSLKSDVASFRDNKHSLSDRSSSLGNTITTGRSSFQSYPSMVVQADALFDPSSSMG